MHATAPTPGAGREKRTLLTALARHAALALSDPETEKAKDVWELAVFGLAGRLRFTTISQPWLREAAKRWATDELPRRRGDGAASVLRSLLAGVVRLSQSLRGSRPDHGDHPALLGRGDIESFLHRMSYLVSTGECSPELRAKTCRDVKRILARIRALGLTRPGGPAAGLGATSPSPAATSPPNPNAANPAATCLRRSWRSCVSSYRCCNADPPAARSGSRSSCSWTPDGDPPRSCACPWTA